MPSDIAPGSAPSHARTRSWHLGRTLATALIAAGAAALLLWVAPPASVLEQIGHMSLIWVLVAIALEVGSCLSYLIVFRRFFPEPPRHVARQVAWIAMGAGAVLPGGNISSAAATGWLLRRHGIGARELVRRVVALLCLLTAFGFVVNGVAAAFLLVGLPGGPHDLSHSGIPILVSIAVLSFAAGIALAARRFGQRVPGPVRGVAAGLEDAAAAVARPHWRLVGAAGFLLLDMGALWAACAATGHPLGFPAVVIAYCIGYLTTVVPVPAGAGVLDTGLAGTLVLYGFAPAPAVGAVLVYHAISIWVPGLGGLIAWLPTRRRRQRSAIRLRELELAPVALAGVTDADALSPT